MGNGQNKQGDEMDIMGVLIRGCNLVTYLIGTHKACILYSSPVIHWWFTEAKVSLNSLLFSCVCLCMYVCVCSMHSSYDLHWFYSCVGQHTQCFIWSGERWHLKWNLSLEGTWAGQSGWLELTERKRRQGSGVGVSVEARSQSFTSTLTKSNDMPLKSFV